MWSATIRAPTSVLPPGGNGTISVMGRFGYACAHTEHGKASSAAAPAARHNNSRRRNLLDMTFPSLAAHGSSSPGKTITFFAVLGSADGAIGSPDDQSHRTSSNRSGLLSSDRTPDAQRR